MIKSLLFAVVPAASKALELFFFCAGIAFLIAGAFRSRAARHRWKARASNLQKRYKMSSHERIEFGLCNLGWTISWALASWDWWMRAAFGAISLVGIVALLYQTDFRREDAPMYDEASTLHLRS